ncbi:MAG TPA: glycosyltransferase family 39 protein [Candidatus Eisenbacteria bacterium]|nr:glycosyltransferase family 39 protein [Candidatus Eisenbacteria bacterium]
MWLAVAVILCFLLGYLVVNPAWSDATSGLAALFNSCLSVCFGIGTFSVIFLIASALNVTHIFKADLFVITLLAAIRLVARRPRKLKLDVARVSDSDLPRPLRLLLITAFAISICVTAYALIVRAMTYPHGDGWDAFAIWNLHARFFFLGDSHWRDGFSNLIPWSHPDYPPLLPAAIAHFWSYLDRDTTAVPVAVGLAFTIATAVFLYASLATSRGHNSAMLGTLTLLSTPFFIEQGAAQYADIPLSFFFLSALVLLNQGWSIGSRRLLLLSGLASGFAAWTKNEGLLFFLSCIIGQALSLLLEKRSVGPASLRRMTTFCAGAAPLLMLVVWYKYLAPPGDLFTGPASMFAKATTISRYWVILQWYGKEFFRFGAWWIVPLTIGLLALYFVTPHDARLDQSAARRASMWTLGLTLAGYFAIYVITPNDLYWHLRFSLNRLFLAVWPCVLFLFFSSVSLRSPQKS